MIGSNGCCTECINACPTAWRSHPDARTLCGSSIDARPEYRPQFAFLSGDTLGTPSVDQIQSQIDANSLPIFRAPIDSGCTATCTNTLAHLVNTRKCNEVFDAANGEKCTCDTIGDMPVLAKDSSGKIFRFVFTNVRYVPGFKYTLISVKQSKREQGIKPSLVENKSVEGNAYSRIMMKELRNMVGNLSKDYQVPFDMFVQGFQYDEIAQKLELPMGTVKSRIFYARKKLKGMCKDRYENIETLRAA